jgi:exosome complex component MTR3
VIIGDRWPKSGVDVIITVLEGEEDRWWGEEATGGANGGANTGSWGFMTVLSACVTAASAALVEAGIDCVDVVAGGVAAIVRNPDVKGKSKRVSSANNTESSTSIVVDPSPSEHHDVLASCVVGYLPQRDEITELWISGNIDSDGERLIDGAIEAARLTGTVLFETIRDMAREKGAEGCENPQLPAQDVTMAG